MEKEMNYQKERTTIVLKKGNIEGFDYVIMSLGTHPTAYIKIPKGHKYYEKDYDDINIDCHGGFTFAGKDFIFNPIEIKNSWWIGWDYAHSGDYMGYYETDSPLAGSGKKWTTKEIYKEVKKVIQQLKED